MSRLYIAPVGSDWNERFDHTVTSPISASDTDLSSAIEANQEVRIWDATEGKQKYSYFAEMETGDPVLFYSDGEFFASGRVGVTLEDATVGE